ncbi:CapA family protein [Patescibacteria group bacterium]|nr:CapA family protein [Patescibacteria group bacterium]
MVINYSHIRSLALICLVILTLHLSFMAQNLKENQILYDFQPPIASTPNPTSTLTLTLTLTPTPNPTPNANYTKRLTDPCYKNWRAKIPQELALTEYLSVISIPEQKHYLFKDKELIKTYTISTGAGENEMPEGIWRVGEIRDSGLGGIYGPRLLFLEVWDKNQFIETTRAFHGTNEPEKIGTNFGLGCVYHYNEDILEIYDLLPPETLVVTTYDDEPANWEILIGGTVVLSRGVDERIRKYQNVNYPWEKIDRLTQSADLTIINLKSAFVEDCPYVSDKPVFCSQTAYVNGLTINNIDLVSLAGNHLGDYGIDGIEYTLDVLNKNNILFTGAGKDSAEAYQPQIIELVNRVPCAAPTELCRATEETLKVGFFSFNTVAGTSPAAKEDSTGVAWWNEQKVSEIIKSLTPHTDIIIAMPNWGPEYTHQPTDDQVSMGHLLVDWGVDIVAGDQAHWIQKYEDYQDGVIFYGLGNLIFDQMWSEKTRQGILVKIVVDKDKNFSYESIPTIIEDYAQPRLANSEESKTILRQIE